MTRTCVFGCRGITGLRMHSFPNLNRRPDQFSVWVSIVGGKLETANDFEIYTRKKVCDLHFAEADKSCQGRILPNAIPTLEIPGRSISPTTTKAEPSNAESEYAINSASVASESHTFIPDPPPQSIFLDSDIEPLDTEENTVIKDHNYSIPVISCSSPEPKCETTIIAPLHTNTKDLRSEVTRLHRKVKTYKARLKNAEKIILNTGTVKNPFSKKKIVILNKFL